VTEKAPPRAKIYDSAGILLAVMGEQDFDPACKNMDIAVDSQERVYVVDTVRLHICLFAPAGAPTGSQPSESDQSGAGRP
jgi:hypothetical protein